MTILEQELSSLSSRLRFIIPSLRSKNDHIPQAQIIETSIDSGLPQLFLTNNQPIVLTNDTNLHVEVNQSQIRLGKGKVFLRRNGIGGTIIQDKVEPNSMVICSSYQEDRRSYPFDSIRVHPDHVFYLTEPVPKRYTAKWPEKYDNRNDPPFQIQTARSITGADGVAIFRGNDENKYGFVDCILPANFQKALTRNLSFLKTHLQVTPVDARSTKQLLRLIVRESALEMFGSLLKNTGKSTLFLKEIMEAYSSTQVRELIQTALLHLDLTFDSTVETIWNEAKAQPVSVVIEDHAASPQESIYLKGTPKPVQINDSDGHKDDPLSEDNLGLLRKIPKESRKQVRRVNPDRIIDPWADPYSIFMNKEPLGAVLDVVKRETGTSIPPQIIDLINPGEHSNLVRLYSTRGSDIYYPQHRFYLYDSTLFDEEFEKLPRLFIHEAMGVIGINRDIRESYHLQGYQKLSLIRPSQVVIAGIREKTALGLVYDANTYQIQMVELAVEDGSHFIIPLNQLAQAPPMGGPEITRAMKRAVKCYSMFNYSMHLHGIENHSGSLGVTNNSSKIQIHGDRNRVYLDHFMIDEKGKRRITSLGYAENNSPVYPKVVSELEVPAQLLDYGPTIAVMGHDHKIKG